MIIFLLHFSEVQIISSAKRHTHFLSVLGQFQATLCYMMPPGNFFSAYKHPLSHIETWGSMQSASYYSPSLQMTLPCAKIYLKELLIQSHNEMPRNTEILPVFHTKVGIGVHLQFQGKDNCFLKNRWYSCTTWRDTVRQCRYHCKEGKGAYLPKLPRIGTCVNMHFCLLCPLGLHNCWH